MLRTLDDASVDVIVTDPPYRTISGGSDATSLAHKRPAGMLAKNDGRIFAHNDVAFSSYLPDLFRVLKSPGHMYLMLNFLNLEAGLAEVRAAGFEVHNLLIWQKNNATPNRWYMKNVEYVVFARKGPARAINNRGAKTCHAFGNVRGKTHPTEKPVALMEHYILNSSQPGDVVLDPFMGTGATGVAALKNGRRFIGAEIDPAYFETASKRLSEVA